MTNQRRKTLMWLLAILGAVVAVVLLFGIFGLDNWRRDLSTNWATTDADAADELLRPLQLAAGSDEVVTAIGDWADAQPHWVVADQQPTGDVTVLHLVRTTRLLRFRDDVTVRVQTFGDDVDGSGTLVTAESRSRTGRADFGQNPRNLREILGALRQAVE